MDGDDPDRPQQHSYSISPARSLLQPLTIAMEWQERSMEARTLQDQTAPERQIEATGQQIDALVYELYALTEEEIGIVDGGDK